MIDTDKLEEIRSLLNSLADVKDKLNKLDYTIETDRDDCCKRNINGFLVSPELYYSVYEQIKSEYRNFYEELKSRLDINIKNFKL